MYNNKTFRSVTNTANGEVGNETLFYYRQQGQIVWADYSGGSIVKGFLIATVQNDNSLNMRYQHVNKRGELMTGRCQSTPEILPDGRIRLHERWQWTSGDGSAGESIIEEVLAHEL
ncbi:n-acetylglutamate synthase [Spirosoma montaniterrae]|uniref:N-acetylglutamate synthase n=1 Tax=Spirosoma montaniterrae TaxID=1178516 RepID=A0A1P9WUF8_9BACT|nr:n-acetylglutamate synthase [Spirosoma montaniterrae]AQG79025.1 n-acetylglutamate synthase [Spirosoma montaniterrae]